MMLQFFGFPQALRKRKTLNHCIVKEKPRGQSITCDLLSMAYFLSHNALSEKFLL